MNNSKLTYVSGMAFAIEVGAPLLFASSAQAAASCSNVGSSGTVATASCSGTGYAQLNVRCNAIVNVRCNAIAPFPTWTDYGSRTYVNGGLTLVNSHASCAAPLTVYVTYG